MMNNKKAISPVIATILLLAITVVIAVTLWQFLQQYAEGSFDDIDGESTLDLAFANKMSTFGNGSGVVVFIDATQYDEIIGIDQIVFVPQFDNGTDSEQCSFGGTVNMTPGSPFSGYFPTASCSLYRGSTYDVKLFGTKAININDVEFE